MRRAVCAALFALLLTQTAAAAPDQPTTAESQGEVSLSVMHRGTFGPALPIPVSFARLAPAFLSVNTRGEVFLRSLPEFRDYEGRVVGHSQKGELVLYTVDPDLHAYAKKLAAQMHSPHVAIVAMEPSTGRMLALAERSQTMPHTLLHAQFPAASLFKIVTAAAALETNTIQPMSKVNYRGGYYTLNKWNYTVDPKRDTRSMSLAEAIGKSCNPVFGRVALKHLVPSRLRTYAERFGFNSDLKFDIPLRESSAHIPDNNYEFSRTAAGFGEVTISPVHAAVLMAAVANGGVLPRPYMVEKVTRSNGVPRYVAGKQHLKRAIKPETAEQLMNMLEYTTTSGTSAREFYSRKRPVLPGIRVAAKTGTLRGKNPIGLNRWFIAAAPIENPKIAVAVLAINPANGASNPSHIGRLILQKYLTGR